MREETAVKPPQSDSPAATGLLQRKCACGRHTTDQHGQCTECKKKGLALQRRAVNQNGPEVAPPIVHEVLRSPGRPLDPATRAYMEPRFGRDFSRVRVHTDGRASESAQTINARAYTVGNHIAFGVGQYAPETSSGERLLAHELAHTVQQRNSPTLARACLEIGAVDNAAEREANRVAEQAVGNRVLADPIPGRGMEVQRLGDLRKAPLGMTCLPANSSPTPPIQTHLFAISASTLIPSQQLDIENFVISWHAAGTNPLVRVDGYASTDGSDELNWQLSCDRAQAVVQELVTPSSGAPGISPANIEFFAQGETSEFSPALEPNRRATITTTSPLPAPICTHPGSLRSVDVQPIFFRSGPTDAAPSGGSWRRRFNESNRIWGKLGVTFNELAPVTLTNATRKTQGGTDPERAAILGLRTGAGIEVFIMDNEVADVGGAARFGPRGPDSKIIMSDRGASNTLLAHELGHALGLGHPGEAGGHGGDTGTIMEPSGSNSTPNPTRNTIVNHNRMTWPAIGSTCLTPDP
ncbi:DUF4157 domain-containing protein [Arthrospira platensis SPKY1]|nr:DUF4157 domain-containing protein [Arthrospira platensis SPKY1]